MKKAALTKTDEIAFDSQAAAALATKAVEIIRENLLTDRDLVCICSAIAAIFSILVTVVLIYKINRLSAVIVTLQMFQGARLHLPFQHRHQKMKTLDPHFEDHRQQ